MKIAGRDAFLKLHWDPPRASHLSAGYVSFWRSEEGVRLNRDNVLECCKQQQGSNKPVLLHRSGREICFASKAEEDGLLDLSSNLNHLCCHYVFIPRLQARLDEFRDGWDNHPLSTEGNRTPNQLWFLGQYHSSKDQVDEDLHIPHIDWEDSGLIPDPNCGVHVPESDYPLRPEELAGLHAAVDPLAPSTCMGVDIYMAAVQYMQSLGYI
ncbi:uncharacterized protein LOC130380193 [Gadus chalcogrammus]|uniref:uncharacterized protein LOC130380193 n=1 Tax=Gadus chalcogrammus TaxID=1042646 RepID=UPI0024C3594D|nr:uncharacterized protein LOC130380193 [Gadus chalcogrammus]